MALILEQTKLLWIPCDDHMWILVENISEDIEKGTVTVKLDDNSEKVYQRKLAAEYDSSHILDLDNLCDMNSLHEVIK
jgi:hypothetical protein